MPVSLEKKACKGARAAAAATFFLIAFGCGLAGAQQTIDAGVTGFDVKRPVLASACPNGCPWGELGDFVKEAMEPFGYEVILCRNCNRAEGPRLVASAGYPPELTGLDTFVGTTTRVNAPVDFGITSSIRLAWAFAGRDTYSEDGPYPNLRLIAKVEDPSYLLAAVKVESGITDLAQIAEQHLPVTVLGGRSPITQPILDFYGLTEEAILSWGGTFLDATIAGQADDPTFDLVITENASPTNNPEAAYWTKITQKHEVRFLDLPETVLDQLAGDATLGVQRAVVKWGFLRGVDRPIPTVTRSGHAVFARDDMPEQAAYDAAKAIDAKHGALKWFIRPYSYDSRTVWDNVGVPLHPGAERYYREVGYLGSSDCRAEDAAATPSGDSAASVSGGCGIGATNGRGPSPFAFVVAWGVVMVWRRRRRAVSRARRTAALLLGLLVLRVSPAAAQTIDAGITGFDVKRPVLASACEHGCPWGELGDFVRDAMQPLDYEIILCRNCNRAEGPRLVANASLPPEITVVDTAVGTTTRVNAPVDFGITESGLLAAAYHARDAYAEDGPYRNLRLIAKIEDPYFLLVAVHADSNITDLSQVAEQKLPVKILGGDSATSRPVLDYYGITPEAVQSWAGSIQNAIVAGVLGITDFDVLVSDLASPANNPESSYWTVLSHLYDLRFLDLPEELLDQMADNEDLGMTRVAAKWGFLRGVDRPIPTVARSGEAIFARDDMPEAVAYDVAKAVDDSRAALRGYIRPYSYDPNTVWENFDVPLHPGAERYYREAGYLPAATRHRNCPDAGEAAAAGDGEGSAGGGGCGCRVVDSRSGSGFALAAVLASLLALRRRPRATKGQPPTRF